MTCDMGDGSRNGSLILSSFGGGGGGASPMSVGDLSENTECLLDAGWKACCSKGLPVK